MAETKCPLCGKSLINGGCDDCGFQRKNVNTQIEVSDFLSQDYRNSEQSGMKDSNNFLENEDAVYKELMRRRAEQILIREVKNQSINNRQKFIFAIIALIVPFAGIVLGLYILTKDPSYEDKNFSKLLMLIDGVRAFIVYSFIIHM
ncbi:MAG TPA: hypothetical protein PKI60_03280 [Oscillospiraceae bacterium]|nr:hypothetical protein [Oscillospiraceae bacterium]